MFNDKRVGISCPALQAIEPVLNSWITCTQRYIDMWEGGDLPYWYNEQANVSILAGAAWKADWTAIEEYQIIKIATEADEKTSVIGRNDLYIADEKNGFCIEAKVAYVPIDNLTAARDWILGKCKLATFEAGRLDYDEPKVGAVFIAPYSLTKSASIEQIEAFQTMLLALPNDALAWVCPTDAQKTPSHDNKRYPMVALLLLNS
ncbi:MAG TPA: hypothetical protein VNV36_03820 [Pseudomonas sp.]|uniref:hypothetical protein n=1 Tax=Pseudomonas sp. TaxID=306 RepID=UPI002BE50695|nr:hypothetical protein [Pseudomonas sp.]HWH85883.1 hypothetical protein [Pseudomonas sp.]